MDTHTGGRCPYWQVVQISVSWRRGVSHGPDCSSDHRDSPVARAQGVRCPCYAGRASSTGRHHPCRDAEADPHGLVDHGDSAVVPGRGGR